MTSYIVKPKSVRKSQIFEKEFSLSGFTFRYINHKNQNYQLLGDEQILAKNIKGFEPGSKEYVDFSENYFVRISEMDDLGFSFDVTKDTKKICPVVTKNKNRYIVWGDICYQTASNVGNVCFYNGKKAFYNSHIRKLELKKDKYYIFAVLKSKFGKEQVDVTGSIKGVDNFREEYLLNTKIPFPTTKNNPTPENVEKLVSLIVQNIIDKEGQIKAKNKLIDEKIERELRENQKENSFSYAYPKISEIKEEGRFDTGLYEMEYNKYEFLLKNYGNDYYFLDRTKISPGVTPKDYHFSDSKKNVHFFDWVTPKNIGGRQLLFNTYIYTKTKSKVKKFSLVLNGIRYVGSGIFVEEGQTIYSNQNTLIVNEFEDKIKQLFLLCFLTSPIGKTMQMIRRNFGIVPILYTEHLCKIPIPYFPESKQKEIAKSYYNKLDKNNDLTFKDYLEKEKTRNKELGIFQLNTEIFRLREIFEDLVHKIVMEEKIEITFDY